MKRAKVNNLYQFLKEFNLTDKAADYLKDSINFNLNIEMSQRKSVGMGKIIGRIISMNYVLQLAQKDFRKDLINGALTNLQEMISKLVAGHSFENESTVSEDYQENSNWFLFV